MSDTPSGPGWWQASDGMWYPPHPSPDLGGRFGQQPPREQDDGLGCEPGSLGRVFPPGQTWTVLAIIGGAIAVLSVVAVVWAVAAGVKDNFDQADSAPATGVRTTTTRQPSTTTTTTAATTTTFFSDPGLQDYATRLDDDTGPLQNAAYEVCKDFIEERLDSPASAEYPDFYEDDDEVRVFRTIEADYRIESQVDSENASGASLRNEFYCVVDYKGKDHWRLVALSLYR